MFFSFLSFFLQFSFSTASHNFHACLSGSVSFSGKLLCCPILPNPNPLFRTHIVDLLPTTFFCLLCIFMCAFSQTNKNSQIQYIIHSFIHSLPFLPVRAFLLSSIFSTNGQKFSAESRAGQEIWPTGESGRRRCQQQQWEWQ